ncbi:SH3 domain-containing protein [Sphingomonas sanxanigenens]|uniref:SH3 domain-containing protein n=1 Tax=Sphingomonas sanxanigenens TaxID=397260 RepID=UPI0004BBE79E|nr:SH3 domain-containing protein [Sphingomonas sanxanigenens]
MSAFRRFRQGLLAAGAVATLMTGVVAPAPAFAAKKAKFADQCAEYRKPFTRIKNYKTNQALKGALIGGILGLGVGLAANSGRQNKGSVLPYVLAGAATGGVVAYVAAKAEQAKDREEVQRAIATDYAGTVDNYDPLAQKIADLGNCRRTQIYSVQSDFESQAIDSKVALERLKLLETWVVKDDEAISGAANQQTSQVADYVRAQRLAEGAKPEETENYDTNSTYYQDATLQPAIYVSQSADGSEPAPPPPPAPLPTTTVYPRSAVNLRAEASQTGAKLDTIPARKPVQVRQSPTQGWYEVELNGQKGYALASLFDGSPPPPPPPPAPAPKKKGVRKIVVQKPAADKTTPKKQVASAVAGNNAAQQARVRSSSETNAQLSDLRLALS